MPPKSRRRDAANTITTVVSAETKRWLLESAQRSGRSLKNEIEFRLEIARRVDLGLGLEKPGK